MIDWEKRKKNCDKKKLSMQEDIAHRSSRSRALDKSYQDTHIELIWSEMVKLAMIFVDVRVCARFRVPVHLCVWTDALIHGYLLFTLKCRHTGPKCDAIMILILFFIFFFLLSIGGERCSPRSQTVCPLWTKIYTKNRLICCCCCWFIYLFNASIPCKEDEKTTLKDSIEQW